jgi:uncharacterized protein YjiS (DUF1127 family)
MITPSTLDDDLATPAAARNTGSPAWWRRSRLCCARYLARRRMRRAIAALDDRLLQDIGLTREAVSPGWSGDRSPMSHLWRWAN